MQAKLTLLIGQYPTWDLLAKHVTNILGTVFSSTEARQRNIMLWSNSSIRHPECTYKGCCFKLSGGWDVLVEKAGMKGFTSRSLSHGTLENRFCYLILYEDDRLVVGVGSYDGGACNIIGATDDVVKLLFTQSESVD